MNNFIKEVRHEMQETTWPSAKDMRKYTSSVFAVVILFTLFFFAAESVLVWLLTFI